MKSMTADRGTMTPKESINEVIDIIMDAVCSVDPQASYMAIPGGYLSEVLVNTRQRE